ncbi:murein biosynthesis integral membrane protein MurJ [Desulfobacterota bacterium AH_259_B03_O07]|nr:murein biosynthesis integral membrane protein MurJ [Desulfobacterota bacterium AH_259_B03_O07]
MNHKEEITRSASLIGSLTLLSRIMGLVRDMVITYFFGAGAQTDAFYVAFRIPNLLRRLFAEGSLTISFIPVFTDYLENKTKEEAKRISDIVFTILFIGLILISIAGIIFSPYIIKLFASGFKGETFNLAVELNRIMFPYIFFISLTALSMGILNSLRHFFAPAFSPVILNIVIVMTVFLIHKSLDVPIISLAIGLIIGGAIQLLFQLPFLKQRDFLFTFRNKIRHPAVKKIGVLMVPQLFGLAVYNLNIIVNTQYASYMPQGTVSYLYLSERLIEFPLGIIAVSIATVLLPSLSSNIAKGEIDLFKDNYSHALRLMLFIMIPALVGLIVLRVPICNILYQRGEFTELSTIYTSQALFGYALGIWAVGGIRITAPTFFSMQDTKTPVIIAFIAFIINAIIGYLLGFTFGLKHTGLALASSISSILNFVLLFIILNKRVGKIDLNDTLILCIKIAIGSILMGVVAWKISTLASWSGSDTSIEKILIMFASVVGSAAVYLLISKILKIEELNSLSNLLKRKRNAG